MALADVRAADGTRPLARASLLDGLTARPGSDLCARPRGLAQRGGAHRGARTRVRSRRLQHARPSHRAAGDRRRRRAQDRPAAPARRGAWSANPGRAGAAARRRRLLPLDARGHPAAAPGPRDTARDRALALRALPRPARHARGSPPLPADQRRAPHGLVVDRTPQHGHGCYEQPASAEVISKNALPRQASRSDAAGRLPPAHNRSA